MSAENLGNGQPRTSATDEQIKLVKQLYQELSYGRQYPDSDLVRLSADEIQKHIAFLISYKRQRKEVENTALRTNGFEQITFSMMYKLTFDEWHRSGAHNCGAPEAFMDRVLEDYKLYNRTKDFVKAHMSNGDAK